MARIDLPTVGKSRRRFRFTLRSVFVLVTIIGGYLGWEMHRLHQRAEVLAWLHERESEPKEKPSTGTESELNSDASDVTPLELHTSDSLDDNFDNGVHIWLTIIRDSKLTWFRRILGDHFLEDVHYPKSATSEELQRVRAAFPEAVILPHGTYY